LIEAIKKHAHLIKNIKLAKYENPIEALIHDYSLSILKHIQGIQDAILDYPPEKRPKAIESLKKMTKENLSKLIHTYANAKKRETDIHNTVVDRPIMKEYEKYAQEIKTTNEKIEEIQKAVDKITSPSEHETKEELNKVLGKHGIRLV